MPKTKLVYIGRRISGDGEISQAFLHGDKEVYFSKIKFLIIGHAYVVDEKGGRFSMALIPEDVGPASYSDELLDKWRALDAQAEYLRRRKAAAAKCARRPELKEVAARLKPLLKGLRWSEKREVVEFIIDELDRESREALMAAQKEIHRKLAKRTRKAEARVLEAEKKLKALEVKK